MRHHRAFTLVELLVVIGIIAVLIGILLPTLAGARRQAATVKCATQLREIGNAFQMYAIENKGYYPPCQIQMFGAYKYNIDGVNYPNSGFGAYWFTFLAKYVTKSRVGYAAGTANDAAIARNSVFWGCPSWEGYRGTTTAINTLGGINPVQLGYGMTYWADATFANPANTRVPPVRDDAYPPDPPRVSISRWSFIRDWQPNSTSYKGTWFKQKTYGINGAQKALVADSRFWALTSAPAPANGVLPRQPYIQNVTDFNGDGQTYADLYRHGKFPPVVLGEFFSNQGGKIAYNILYCDGHVATTGDWREAYRSVRMKFPG